MNSDILQDDWQQIREDVKLAFNKLTEDDLEQANGAVDKMLVSLQTRYGYTKVKAKVEWDGFIRRRDKKAIEAQHQTENAVDNGQTAATPIDEKVQNSDDNITSKLNLDGSSGIQGVC